MKANCFWLDCDEPDVRQKLTDVTSTELKNWVGDAELVLIDEAQRVKNIGITLKLFTDKLRSLKLLVTGSSSLEIANEINEPLTGRKWEFMLLPISTEELVGYHGEMEERRLLEHRMVYGFYPEVINRPGKEEPLLRHLSSSYLYKDIFTFQDVRKPEVLEKLLQALALQIGSEVNYHELAQLTGSDQATVQRYIRPAGKGFCRVSPSCIQSECTQRIEKEPKNLFLRQRHPKCYCQQLQAPPTSCRHRRFMGKLSGCRTCQVAGQSWVLCAIAISGALPSSRK